MAGNIEKFAAGRNMRVVGHIPFDPVFTRAMLVGRNVVDHGPGSPAAAAIYRIWREILLIVDTETMDYETVDNSANVNAFKGAGIQAATMVADKGAQVLLTGYCGPNAFRTVQAAGMKVVSDVAGTVRQAIETFKGGQMTYSEGPNAEGHR